MERDFDQLARWGENEPWRWFLSGGILLFCWFVCLYLFGRFVVDVPAILAAVDGNPNTAGAEDLNPSLANLVDYTLALASFAVVLAGLFVAARFVHRRPLSSFVTPGSHVRWGRVAFGFGVWAALTLVLLVVGLLQESERFRVLFEPAGFAGLAVLVLLLVPIQVAAQILFFGGYLLQGLSLLTGRKPLILGVVGISFAVAQLFGFVFEGFADFLGMAVYWSLFGAFLAFVALRDNGLELVLGFYFANRIFSNLLFDYEYSIVPQPALFVISGSGMSPADFVLLAFALLLFYLTVFRVFGPEPGPVK